MVWVRYNIMHTMVMLAVVLIMFESVRHSILRLVIEIDRNNCRKCFLNLRQSKKKLQNISMTIYQTTKIKSNNLDLLWDLSFRSSEYKIRMKRKKLIDAALSTYIYIYFFIVVFRYLAVQHRCLIKCNFF